MDISWIAISQAETSWLVFTFFMGLLAYRIGLPPMVGFLAVGFILNAYGIESTDSLREIADLGVTIMLFTIGLKLDLKSLLRIQVWGVASAHILITMVIYSLLFILLQQFGVKSFANLDLGHILIITFALSFSSTVFAVKVLESKNDMRALYAQIAIGILIVQDIFAVLFLTVSTGILPSPFSLILLGLPLIRPFLYNIMDQVKHGELLILYSLILAVGGAALFELVGLKADLGALIFGLLLSNHKKAYEVSTILYNFKDLFLIGFFINIGLSGDPSVDNLLLAIVLSLMMFIKMVMYYGLLIKTQLRARTSFLTSLSLASYSEFGLIVGSYAVHAGWMSSDWLVSIAIALSITFVISSPLNRVANRLYDKYSHYLLTWQSEDRLSDEKTADISGSGILVFGMGLIGTGVYDYLNRYYPNQVIGLDFDDDIHQAHVKADRQVIYADVMDNDFWSDIDLSDLSVVFLNLHNASKNIFSIKQLRNKGFDGMIVGIAMYEEDFIALKEAGISEVYNVYSEAGYGFAEDVRHKIKLKNEV